MPESMTGYGRGVVQRNGLEIIVELRSENARFCDVVMRTARVFQMYEDRFKQIIQRQLRRGRIACSIFIEGENITNGNMAVNHTALASGIAILGEIKERAGIKDPLKLEHLLQLNDVVINRQDESIVEEYLSMAEEALGIAVEEVITMRGDEGSRLVEDLAKRLEKMDATVSEVEKQVEGNAETQFNKTKERIESLLTDVFDEQRLHQELALLADKLDVSEEIVRFRSHHQQFGNYLKANEAVGKRMNFLLQEMNREVNTISSKSNDVDITYHVVEIKNDIEILREQVQNIL